MVDRIARLGSVNPEKVGELLQAELNTVETQNGQNKQLLIDLNGALTQQDQQVETLRGQARALEQYRVEAIFRIFSMKGQVPPPSPVPASDWAAVPDLAKGH